MSFGTMRFWWIAALLAAGLLVASRGEARGQEIRDAEGLAAAVRAADGTAVFEFRARPAVWGDGRTWNYSSDEPARPSRHCPGCTNGPVIVEVRVAGGRETDVEAQVGGTTPGGRSLGIVTPEVAASYLIDLVETTSLDPDAREEALQAAVAADGVEIWPRLLRVAKDRGQVSDVREAALFWTAHEAGVRAASDIEDIAIATDEETDVQEAAVFALTQLPAPGSTDALLRLARENRNPEIVRTVYFWLGQQDDPRVVALFEDVLLD